MTHFTLALAQGHPRAHILFLQRQYLVCLNSAGFAFLSIKVGFRQRLKLIKQVPVRNNIVYFYPDVLAKKIQNKLDLLRSIGVTPFSIAYSEGNKMKYYQSVLKKIGNDFK